MSTTTETIYSRAEAEAELRRRGFQFHTATAEWVRREGLADEVRGRLCWAPTRAELETGAASDGSSPRFWLMKPNYGGTVPVLPAG
jgi:hypothetical protein